MLADRLQTAGCSVNRGGTDWQSTGDLTPPVTPGGGLPLGRKVPSSESAGRPRLSATLRSNGRGRMDDVVITNHGPGDVFELSVEAPDEEGLLVRMEDGFPVPRLPAGKSVRAMRSQRLGSSRGDYFTVTLTGRTADGTELRVEEFVSGG